MILTAAGVFRTVSVTNTLHSRVAPPQEPVGGQQRAGQPADRGAVGTGVSSTTNLALNRPVTASSSTVQLHAADGGGREQHPPGEHRRRRVPADHHGRPGSSSIGLATLDEQQLSAWSTRTQTLLVLGSTNGTTFSQHGSAGYTFNPSTVEIRPRSACRPSAHQRPLRAAQLHRQHRLVRRPALRIPGLPWQRVKRRQRLSASPSSLSFGNQTAGSTTARRRSRCPTPTAPPYRSRSWRSAARSTRQYLRCLDPRGRVLRRQHPVRPHRLRRG